MKVQYTARRGRQYVHTTHLEGDALYRALLCGACDDATKAITWNRLLEDGEQVIVRSPFTGLTHVFTKVEA